MKAPLSAPERVRCTCLIQGQGQFEPKRAQDCAVPGQHQEGALLCMSREGGSRSRQHSAKITGAHLRQVLRDLRPHSRAPGLPASRRAADCRRTRACDGSAVSSCRPRAVLCSGAHRRGQGGGARPLPPPLTEPASVLWRHRTSAGPTHHSPGAAGAPRGGSCAPSPMAVCCCSPPCWPCGCGRPPFRFSPSHRALVRQRCQDSRQRGSAPGVPSRTAPAGAFLPMLRGTV